jgi:hypothetical protein
MALDITGKLIQKLDVQSGEGARGSWSRQEAIIETIEQYPRKICIQFWGERISDLQKINLGDTVTASINIDSRESNGKWYTSIRAWRVQTADAANNQQLPTTSAPQDIALPTAADFPEPPAEIDDLPF